MDNIKVATLVKPKISLQTSALSIGYAQPRKPAKIVAQNLDLSLKAGELVCLIGPNGAGKSTLLHTLAGTLPPLAGQVRLMGDDLHRLKADALAKRLSIVLTTHPDMGLMTGYELVALGRHPYTGWSGGLTAHDEAIVQEAILAVGVVEFAARPVAELSDGQRQKIWIARALAQEPAVLLLDEPTAYLDLPRRVELMNLLRRLTRETDRAILLSTHDLELALRTADRLWLMSAGGDLHVGAPEDLILSGAFEDVFRGEGVEFDVQTGSFKVAQPNHGEVSLIGEGLVYQWTRRGLERAGFAVVDKADVQIEAVDAHCWRLTQDSVTREYTILADLFASLQQ